MELFTTYPTAKRNFFLFFLVLLLLILSGIFSIFQPFIVLLFCFFLVFIALLLLFFFGEKKQIAPVAGSQISTEANENGFRLIADQIPFMVWRSDADGKCIYVNKKWIEFTGLSYEGSLGFGFVKSMAIPENQRRRQEWWKMIKDHQPYELKFQLKDQRGDLRWVLAQANAYYIGTEFRGYIGSIIDITEQESSTIAIQELSDRKDEFLSIASHELKTPLTSIKALFQLIERNIAPDHQVFRFLDRANNNILKLETLINDLLDVSKINAGKLSYDYSEFAFHEMLNDAILNMQHIAPDYQFVLRKSDPVIFMGDKFRLEQVIFNFLSNAIKYSPDCKEIIINSEVLNGNIIVSVQDFGIGIKKENLTKIFNRYYRVDNTIMKFEGLGLGLFISSEIIKRHHGSFWIESEFGEGATFYFILPLTNQHKHAQVITDEFSYYEDETIKIQILADKDRMDVNWTGYQNFKSVQDGCLIMLDLVKKNPCTKILNDNSEVRGNWSEASDWVSAECIPALAAAGITHVAWIYSPSIFSQLAAEKSVDLSDHIVIRFFNDKVSAADWLDSV